MHRRKVPKRPASPEHELRWGRQGPCGTRRHLVHERIAPPMLLSHPAIAGLAKVQVGGDPLHCSLRTHGEAPKVAIAAVQEVPASARDRGPSIDDVPAVAEHLGGPLQRQAHPGEGRKLSPGRCLPTAQPGRRGARLP
jgi:hypothetical protein